MIFQRLRSKTGTGTAHLAASNFPTWSRDVRFPRPDSRYGRDFPRGRNCLPRLGAPRQSRLGRRRLQRLPTDRESDVPRGGGFLVHRRRGRESRAGIPLLAGHRNRPGHPHRSVRARSDQLHRQRRHSRSALRLGRRPIQDSELERTRHVRTPRRHLRRRRTGRRRSREVRKRRAPFRLPQETRHQLHPDHAHRRVRRGSLVGLQSRPYVRRRIGLRRSEGLQGTREASPQKRHRGDSRRGLQPLRPERPRPLALRRLERTRRRRNLLLQRRASHHPVGRHPAGLRPAAGAAIHPRQRADVARRVPRRRPAHGHDSVHPRRRRLGQPSSARRLEPDAVGEHGSSQAFSEGAHHRRRPPK